VDLWVTIFFRKGISASNAPLLILSTFGGRVALTTGRNHHSAGFGVITEQSSRYPGYDHRYWAGEGEHQRNPKAKWIRDFLVRPARLVNHVRAKEGFGFHRCVLDGLKRRVAHGANPTEVLP
jgi:hypothetical protein